ncbi:DNA-binding winged helix-turn-helix (wHTH) protein [Sphingomonas sp. F9_3S_D5_B_2]
MLKVADLAGRADIKAGPLTVSPARRVVEGPAGRAHLEPIVMKVFLLLLDGRGSVVTRDELFGNAWGGVFVGDDSLNRAIARLRKIAGETAPGLFEIETVPRTGYRLTGSIVQYLDGPEHEEQRNAGSAAVSRRLVIGSAAACGALAAAGGGALLLANRRSNAQFDALLAAARTAMNRNEDAPDANARTTAMLRKALQLRPDSAEALGRLAYVQSQTRGGPGINASTAARAQEDARRALALDRLEPSALLALYELEGQTLDWFTRDQRLRQIIALDRRHVPAISELVALLQSTGLNRESWDLNERAIAIEPLSAELRGRRALKLWIARQDQAADMVIDQARALWPSSGFVWWVHFLILATTGRALAAKAMLDKDPNFKEPPWVAFWRAALAALIEPTPGNLATARKSCLEGAKSAGGLATSAVMVLGALNEVDAAFEVCNGFLLWRGSVVRAGTSVDQRLGSDSGWRMSVQWLFTPPCAALRHDPRFTRLCADIGLADYWKRRGVQPEYLRLER